MAGAGDNLDALPVLRLLLLQALEVSMAQMTACNGQHGLPRRLARWLLMAHDRVDGDELAVEQKLVAKTLAVRRAGVAGALASLHAAGAVSRGRGRILVCDRAGLEAAACGCYGHVQAFAAAVAARNTDPVDLAA